MYKKIPLIPLIELTAKGLSFIIIIILTRLLSLEEYGVLNYVISIVLIASVLMDGGINNYIFNKSIKDEIDDINDYFNSRLFLSLVVIVILLIYAYFFQKKYFDYILLYAFFVFFNSSLAFFKMLARGQNNRIIDINSIILDPTVRLVILGFIYFLEIKTNLLFILKIFIMVEIGIFFWVFLLSKKPFYLFFSFAKIFSKLKFILIDSKYFLLYYLFFVAIQRIDVLFINHTLSHESVALFSSAYNLYMVLLLFFSSYLTSGFKQILKSKNKFSKYVKNILICYIFIMIFIVIFSELIFQILYPIKYFEANVYLKIFLISLPFTIISYFGLYFMNYIGKTQLNTLILFIFFIVKAILLSLLHLNSNLSYVYFLVSIEILLGITYFIILLKHKEYLV